MDQQFQNELQLTRASFFKLQNNFNHNLLVIQQLQQQNDKLAEDNQKLKQHYHQQVDSLHGVVEELKYENKRLNQLVRSEVEKARALCQEETQHMLQMMNEKMMEQKRFQMQKFGKQRKQAQLQIQKYQESLKHYSIQNSKLNQAIKSLRNQKQLLQQQVQSLSTQKQNYMNKFSLHQKQLQSIRNSNEQWQRILKDKVKQATKQKQRVQEQLSQTKIAIKLKMKTMKQQASKKIQQIEVNRQKQIKLLTLQAKQIKFKFDSTIQQMEKLKMENKNYEKEVMRLQQTIKQLSKQANSQKQVQYLKKMFEQQKVQLKNQIKMLESQKNQIKQQFKEVNQTREQKQKAIQRLKITLQSTAKQNHDKQKMIKRLQRQLKNLRNQVKKAAQITNMNFRGYQKFDNADMVNESILNNQNQFNMGQSKQFTQDQGPIDFPYMQNSFQNSPKNAQMAKNSIMPANIQLMKKIGELQLQIDEYKNVIKRMTEEIQKIKSTYIDQIGLKDQQIKLGRDEVHLLRQKINEREQQLLTLNSLRAQVDEKTRKLQEQGQKKNKMQAQLAEKSKQVAKQTKQIDEYSEKIEQLQQKIKNYEQEKNILDQINQQLRGQIHRFKNRVKLYEQSSQSNEQFQEIQFDESPSISEQIMKKSHEMKRTSKTKINNGKSRSRSKSNPKERQKISPINSNLQGSNASMKLKDLVLKKKQIEMQGRKMQLQYKEPNSNKTIQKIGTASQKQILQNMKKKSKQKHNARAERLKNIDYNRLIGRDELNRDNEPEQQ